MQSNLQAIFICFAYMRVYKVSVLMLITITSEVFVKLHIETANSGTQTWVSKRVRTEFKMSNWLEFVYMQ